MAGAGRIARAFGDAELVAKLAEQATPPVAGYLTYNPGPGIYSRLERAVEAMPENVRAQEIPGLIKRYKDGVPGWELKAVNLDSVVAGRDVVPRSEILAAVKERSPVYTHREVVLSEAGPHMRWEGDNSFNEPGAVPRDQMPEPARIGTTADPQGQPVYPEYGQGGDNYTEVLLTQPVADLLGDYGNHWGNARAAGTGDAVAHARFDTHGDALRINELQSDLGIHNRKQREHADLNPQILFGERLNPASQAGIPFPLEDAWADILIKRLALEAARKGHRAIEVASPRAIADKVGGNIDNYEHFYGKVVPGALERLGRKMGGLTADRAATNVAPEPIRRPGYDVSRSTFAATDALNDAVAYADGLVGRLPGQRSIRDPFEDLADVMRMGQDPREYADAVYEQLVRSAFENGWPAEAARTLVGQSMPQLMRRAEDVVALNNQRVAVAEAARGYRPPQANAPAPGRRYLMSDEMRKRIIEQGIPASVLAPLLMQQDDSP